MDKKKFEDLGREILKAVPAGTQFDGVLATQETLEEITGYKAECYDHYVDDSLDARSDEDDGYVMCAAFRMAGAEMTVRIYYGDQTETVFTVEVSQR